MGLAALPDGGPRVVPVTVTLVPGSGGLHLAGPADPTLEEAAQVARSVALGWTAAREALAGRDARGGGGGDGGRRLRGGPRWGSPCCWRCSPRAPGARSRRGCAPRGEITLRGLLLPLSGLEEWVAAAAGAGMRTLIVPAANGEDVAALPAERRRRLAIAAVPGVDAAVRAALGAEAR
uniref:ATP-dependent protease La Type I n=1 Tax=uncultured bacterium AB_1383 TaxID=1630010 RepID=A0A0E3GLV6_9BACT|nr:ATP-dependent protease La Type I [uncultured bacterium AB_1383]